MPVCKTCSIDYPLDNFYTIKQKKGNYTYRKECKYCFTNKEKNRYYDKVEQKGRYRISSCTSCQEWLIKSQHFSFSIDKCNSCTKLDTIVQEEEQSIQQDESPEITPLELEPEPLERTCRICNVSKPVHTGYYRSAGLVCKNCRRLKENDNRKIVRQKELEEYGGSEFVRQQPNDYTDEYQRKHTFDVMEAIGWKLNTENNIWYKDGIKTKDGVFINVIPDVKPVIEKKPRVRIRKKLGPTFKDKMEMIKKNNIKNIINLYEQGNPQHLIAALYKVSRPTITKWIKEHKESL
jgi:hypothetical protein